MRCAYCVSIDREEQEDPTSAIVQELRQLEIQDAVQESKSGASCEFGDRRNQMLEDMRKRNGPFKDSFKPFRYWECQDFFLQ